MALELAEKNEPHLTVLLRLGSSSLSLYSLATFLGIQLANPF